MLSSGCCLRAIAFLFGLSLFGLFFPGYSLFGLLISEFGLVPSVHSSRLDLSGHSFFGVFRSLAYSVLFGLFPSGSFALSRRSSPGNTFRSAYFSGCLFGLFDFGLTVFSMSSAPESFAPPLAERLSCPVGIQECSVLLHYC